MIKSYHDLIIQAGHFPQEEFHLKNGFLQFHDLPLKQLIDEYGTPLRLTYLPSIGKQINRAKNWFNNSIAKHNYKGAYQYCYCTKSSHFEFIIKEALKQDVNLETSSSFDIDLILKLYEKGDISSSVYIIHNGYKSDEYLKKIIELHHRGFSNTVIVLDSIEEFDRLDELAHGKKIKIGIRVATDLPPNSSYYTSRLGIRPSEVLPLFEEKIRGNEKFELMMFHFFVDSGIKDNLFYWGEFKKALAVFVQLKEKAESLTAFNIGGGFPFRNKLGFDYDYQHMTDEIIRNVKEACEEKQLNVPDIFTEFGKFSVGESGAVLFKVLEEKQQNDQEDWYIINNSLMNTIPDAWSILEKFILLPVNKWENEYKRVNIGGISCDYYDYYNSEELNQQIFLPELDDNGKHPLYIGFFNTGAYQEAMSGYGGIKHCLIPSPKHVIIDKDNHGNLHTTLFRGEQKVEDMLKILGY